MWTPNTSKHTITLIYTSLHSSSNTIMVFKILYYCVKCKEKNLCTDISEVLIWSGLCKGPCRDYAEEQQFCWNPEHLGLDPNEAKILPGDSEVGDESPGGRAVLCTCRACSAFPFSCTCCQPRAPSGMLWDSTFPPTCAERSTQGIVALPDWASSILFLHLIPQEAEWDEKKIYCFLLWSVKYVFSCIPSWYQSYRVETISLV